MSSILSHFVRVGLLLAVVFTVLAHGAVESWSVAVFQLCILLLTVAWGINVLVSRNLSLRLPITFWPIFAYLLYGVIQCIRYETSDGQTFSLSLDVGATRGTVLLFFFLCTAYVISANHFTSERNLIFLINFLSVFGVILSILSIIQYLTKESVFFLTDPGLALSPWLSGPFVNHNHFAGFVELIIPLPLALVLFDLAGRARGIYIFASSVMAIAAILTASRGGIISIASSLSAMAVFTYLAFRRKPTEKSRDSSADGSRTRPSPLRNLLYIAVLLIGVVLGTLWIGIDPVVERLPSGALASSEESSESFETSRGWVWANSWKVFKAHPIAGVGMGAFETAFPHFSSGYPASPTGQTMVWERTHNDYLQVLTDTGLIGGVITAWFLVTLLYTASRGLRCSSRINVAFALGGCAAIFSLLVHSFFDFNLQLPSTSLLFLILAGAVDDGSLTNDKAA